ncbi:hypothetical protein BU24DRAFT_467584 [Aaosphaeria arxii CBS 175.79]|uniref:Uncharacterized protein n=1 Tax=Aaosphaeria arxii CBS 175.79 TaxID=1450172 RepID=A0A6A5XAU3_9PLEO|nr:uncharacterized protein BU24DRAFT_467584 [Aaosphaeria arxii CBS 175.79]KAF2010098.1 hypothetical protein BU24DRAFT_467584 [Aaosphaeria arxii CBS 175.79]
MVDKKSDHFIIEIGGEDGQYAMDIPAKVDHSILQNQQNWLPKSKFNPDNGDMNCVWVTVAVLLDTTTVQLAKDTGINQSFINGTNLAQLQTLLNKKGLQFVIYEIEKTASGAEKYTVAGKSVAPDMSVLPARHGAGYRRADGSGHMVVRVLDDSGDIEAKKTGANYTCYQRTDKGENVAWDVAGSQLEWVMFLLPVSKDGAGIILNANKKAQKKGWSLFGLFK